MGHPKMSRRVVLRGIGLGGIAIALPPLEAIGPGRTPARADTPPANRFLLFHFPNGPYMQEWIPAVEGRDYELPDQLDPIRHHRDRFDMLSGLSTVAGGAGLFGTPHGHPNYIFTTGVEARRGDHVTGPSIDQVIARELLGSTPIPSLYTAPFTRIGGHFPISWSGPGSSVPAITDPSELFRQLFAPDMSEEDRMRLVIRRRSILDFVRESGTRLRDRVSVMDRHRIEEHLDAVRALEVSLDAFGGSCEPPDPPGEAPLEELERRCDLLTDLTVMALRCGLTRVAVTSLGHTQATIVYDFLGNRVDDHQTSHLNGDRNLTEADLEGLSDEERRELERDTAAYWQKEHTRWKMARFARLFDALATTSAEGGASLLDRTVVVCASELSHGELHMHQNLPVLVAGAGLAGGRHRKFPCNPDDVTGTSAIGKRRFLSQFCSASHHTPLSNLWLTALHAMGIHRETFGSSTGTLEGLWT